MDKLLRMLLGLGVVAVLSATQIGGCDLPESDDEIQIPNFTGTFSGTNLAVDCTIGATTTTSFTLTTYTITLSQSGGNVAGTITGTDGVNAYAGALTGTISGMTLTITSFTLTGGGCDITAAGSGTLNGNTLTFTVSGTATGCCVTGTISISGAATR